MKKVSCIVLLSGLAIAVSALAYLKYGHTDKPDYIKAAERRVGSYLTSDYGPVSCKDIRMDDGRWQLECLNATGQMKFEYSVYPADKAPWPVARPFYLEARNENARQSAHQGLMRYLQMGER